MSKIKLTTKLSWEKPDDWAFFWVATLCHGHSTLASQTREGLHQLWALPQHKAIFFFFFDCLGIQFFNSLTLLPSEAEDFPRSERNFKHVPPLTFLTYFPPKEIY